MKLAIVTLILGLFGLIVCILSTALDYWYLYSGEQGNAHFGLWILCFSFFHGNEMCHTWKSVESCVCAIIAVSVFGTKVKKIYPEQGSFHAGFGLAVCGAVLGLVTGLLIGSHKIAYASI